MFHFQLSRLKFVDNLTANFEIVLLTFQLIDFIDTEHQFTSLVKLSIKIKLAEVIFDQSKFQTSVDINRTRAISEARLTSEISNLFRF